ncbi:peptide-N(4)-(N-acetyl-beta-glucosaminyl)asparagine amidase [Daktulosphaira vitifoliae]|uniref:peptide-N(4)-(N-acetyl-beta- glucosaminyl)asparagine amidase n=1 Tax=Daktulosphaira vitifoliae TaxID=58002 RepID=UPI0021AA90DD|nr:peptide-N(4)-(N-acetyl-beta-glucosaminyl)asparagine amidase [Daktulosphaira vitifoliae]
MLQSLNDLKSNDPDICFRIINVLIKIIDNILNNPHLYKFRRLCLNSNIIQNELLPYIGAMEFLLEIGFIENNDVLVLPDYVDQSALEGFKQELLQIIKIDGEPIISLDKNNKFLNEINSISFDVLSHENKILQKKALECLSTEQVSQFSIIKNSENDSFSHENKMLELMKWFKQSFFKWFDVPHCKYCCIPTKFKEIKHGTKDLNVRYVEIYKCPKCNWTTEFKRFKLCEQLLITRNGRCGEWANCFTLFCRALGWEARYVVDQTDHVWTEVWSVTQERWIHCDSCEVALDKPLLYEKGWGKKLSYIIAFSHEEVQDVTWRYTIKNDDILTRRILCNENDLLKKILLLSEARQQNVSYIRRKYLAERRLKECFELLFGSKNIDTDNYSGRISGALDWKLSRGETRIQHFVWTPTQVEISKKKFEIKYSTALDQYIHDGQLIKGWQNGVYYVHSIFRKEEFDWKKVYLCREENSNTAKIEWMFDFTESNLAVERITLIYLSSLFETGDVKWILTGNNNSVVNLSVIQNVQSVHIDQFIGCNKVKLIATLFGGSGEHAWQHTQLFRQDSDSEEFPLQVLINLK